MSRVPRSLALALALWLASESAVRAELPSVEEVITATADARDLARFGDRVLVATDGGLVVLREGHVERVIGPREGLPGARLRSVSVVGDSVWVGTVEGTARLDAELRVIERFPVRRVHRVVEAGGRIWLASHGDGLHRVEGSTTVEVRLGRPHAYRRLTDLLAVGAELWVATHGAGVVRVDPASARVIGRSRARGGLVSDYVWRLREANGRVLVATVDGASALDARGAVLRGDRTAIACARLPVRDLRDVQERGDVVYAATFGGGLIRVDREGVVALGQGDAYALLSDGDGVLMGHADGIARVTSTGVRPIVRGGLASGDVTALAHAFGALFVGTFDRGLVRRDAEGRFEMIGGSAREALDPRVNDLAVTRGRDGAETLWIATDRGIYTYDDRTLARVEDPVGPSWIHTTSLHVDPQGALWSTNGRELCRNTQGRWRCWTGDPRSVAQFHAVTTDRRGRVWVGGLHGLYRFDPETGHFSRHSVSSGDLPVDWVTAIVPWGSGVMAGTYHGGLSVGDEDAFAVVREGQAGLPSGWVNPHALFAEGDEVWIGTLERGLVIGHPGAFARLTTAQGLPSDDVTDVLFDASGAWVATRGGLARMSRVP